MDTIINGTNDIAGKAWKPIESWQIGAKWVTGRLFLLHFGYASVRPYILRPYKLQPYILRTYKLRPYIFRPYKLRYYIFRPYKLGPYILRPYKLRSDIFGSYKLGPYILRPYILLPQYFFDVSISTSVPGLYFKFGFVSCRSTVLERPRRKMLVGVKFCAK